jgi:short-subunit dehydrogenase
MLPQGSGSIVNVSSAYGSIGAAGASVYTGMLTRFTNTDESKAAVVSTVPVNV